MRRAAKVDAPAAAYLGSLCRRGHDHEGTGMSLRHKHGECVACNKIRRDAVANDPVRLERQRQKQRERNARNRARRNEQSRASKQRNKDEIERRRRERYFANHEESLARDREYRKRNAEKIRRKNRKWRRAYRQKNPEKAAAYSREYYAKNSLRIRIRNRVYKAFRQQKLDKALTVAGYGIDVPAIAAHLGPCPGSSSDWHIDHIRPLASFDFSNPDDVKAAFAPENHQWLRAEENLRKQAKYG